MGDTSKNAKAGLTVESTVGAEKQAAVLASIFEQMAKAPQSLDTLALNTKVGSLLEQHLAAGDEPVFDLVVNRLSALEATDAIEAFLDDLEDIASHRPIKLSAQPTSHYSIFAIPVVLLTDCPLNEVPQVLSAGAAFDEFVGSIKGHTLPETDCAITVLPYLYTPLEISSISPSQLWQLGPKIQEGAGAGEGTELGQMSGAVEPPINVGVHEGYAGLRYLVGLAVANQVGTYFEDPSTFDSELDDATYDARQDAYNVKMTHWCAAASKLLEAVLAKGSTKDVEMLVQPIAPFFPAYRTGLQHLVDFGVVSAVQTTLAEKCLFAQEVWAIVAPFGEDGLPTELRISLVTNQSESFIYGVVREIFEHEEPAEVAADLGAVLDSLGISRVEFGEKVTPLTYRNGEPIFLTPGKPDGVTNYDTAGRATAPSKALH